MMFVLSNLSPKNSQSKPHPQVMPQLVRRQRRAHSSLPPARPLFDYCLHLTVMSTIATIGRCHILLMTTPEDCCCKSPVKCIQLPAWCTVERCLCGYWYWQSHLATKKLGLFRWRTGKGFALLFGAGLDTTC